MKRPSKRERQFKHILASELAAGESESTAVAIAAATVNKTRAKLARSGKGPKLIKDGGSRRQFYPGKEKAMARRAKYYVSVWDGKGSKSEFVVDSSVLTPNKWWVSRAASDGVREFHTNSKGKDLVFKTRTEAQKRADLLNTGKVRIVEI